MVSIVRLAAAAFALAASAAAFAQGYPSKPVKVVVPWPPGQATDVAARAVADKLSLVLGQSFVIDNRAGAGGTMGTDFAAKAPPDGYTILAGSSGPISISPHVQKVPYDPDKDLEPIALIASTPYVLVVTPSLPVATVQEFIALLRANPGKYNFASSGTGATSHLVGELFNSTSRVTATHVPYKGSSPALTDVIAGHVTYTFETSASVLAYVKAGKLKALAVSSAARALSLPEIPTLVEAVGYAGFDLRAWIGLVAPAGIPREARARLAAETQRALSTAEMKERLLGLGLEPSTLTAEEFGPFVKQQNERFGAIARQAKIQVQ
jgi:tripartite-type tricarboxylate transporter receptor subunit TctC